MSFPYRDDAETTPSQGVVPSAPRRPLEEKPPLPSTSYGSPRPVGQVPMNLIVSDSASFGYFPFMDLLRIGLYKTQFYIIKPKTFGHMFYSSTMQTTIEQISVQSVGTKVSIAEALAKELRESPLADISHIWIWTGSL